ncbi:uncharacterized protein LOC129580840 isoform X2 [Paramacrobiotus metropolitanus]|uniref:uncharacterized protein LOC129580840 isoform X2 n=1 Tax=Paramacrobiotus metropolitanus TaxID=2943436 RepID=UPI002445EF27|nr:uncharacterized protein LOC129580840 isoform X2 [Paramacrobiotus metropolitanus]
MTLHGNDFAIIRDEGMIPAVEVLADVEEYALLTGISKPAFPRSKIADKDREMYREYVARRLPYLHTERDRARSPERIPDMVDKVVPERIRSLYSAMLDGLNGPEWNLLPIDAEFFSARDAILEELTTLGLVQAAWYFIVDNLPSDRVQLRGALLKIMPEKLRTVWVKSDGETKSSRVLELVNRLKLLMELSRANQTEQNEFFSDLKRLIGPQQLSDAEMERESMLEPAVMSASEISGKVADEISFCVVSAPDSQQSGQLPSAAEKPVIAVDDAPVVIVESSAPALSSSLASAPKKRGRPPKKKPVADADTEALASSSSVLHDIAPTPSSVTDEPSVAPYPASDVLPPPLRSSESTRGRGRRGRPRKK